MRVRLTGWGCFAASLTLVGLVIIATILMRPEPSGPMTAARLSSLRAAALGQPTDSDPAIELALGYASLASEYQLFRAGDSVLGLVENNPGFKASEEVIEKRDNLKQLLDARAGQLGFGSKEQMRGALQQGLADTEGVLTAGLTPEEVATVRLSRAQILLQLDRPADALAEISKAEAHGDPVAIELFRGDALVALERYGDAIQAYRGASLALTSWAQRDPGLGTKLLWSIGGHYRAGRRERTWKERRERIASNLRGVIADQIRTVQGLERIQQKGVGSELR